MAKKQPIPFTPAEGYVLAEPLSNDSSEDILYSGGDFDQLAKVIEVGKSTYYPSTNLPFHASCKKGDIILHSSVGFENFRHEGKKYRMIKFQNVMGIKT